MSGKMFDLQINTELIPDSRDAKMHWAGHLLQFLLGDAEHPPAGVETMVVDANPVAVCPIPVSDLRSIIGGMRDAISPNVTWNDDQIVMAREAIKNMKSDIDHLCDRMIVMACLQDEFPIID